MKKILIILTLFVPLLTMAQTVNKASTDLYIRKLDQTDFGENHTLNYSYYYDENNNKVRHGKFSIARPQKDLGYYISLFNASGSYNHNELNGPISIKLTQEGRGSYAGTHLKYLIARNSLSGYYDNGVPDKQWTINFDDDNSKLSTTVVLDKGRLCKFKTVASGDDYCREYKNKKTSVDVSIDKDGYASGFFYWKDGDRGVLKSGVLTNFFIRKDGEYSPLGSEEKAVIAEIVAHNGKVDEYDLMERGYMLEETTYNFNDFFAFYFDKVAINLVYFDNHLDRFPTSFKYKVLTKNFTNPFDKKKENVRTLVNACAGQGALGDMRDKMHQAEEAILALRQEAERIHSQRLIDFCDEYTRQIADNKFALAQRSVRELESKWSADKPDWSLLSNADILIASMRKDLGGDDSSSTAISCMQNEQKLLPYKAFYSASCNSALYGDVDMLATKTLAVLNSKAARFSFLNDLITLGYKGWSKAKVNHYMDLAKQESESNQSIMDLYSMLLNNADNNSDYASVVEYADVIRLMSKNTPINPKYGDVQNVNFLTQKALYQLNRQKEHLGSPIVVDRELFFERHDSILTFDPASHQIVPSAYYILIASDNTRVIVRPGQYAILPNVAIDQNTMNSIRWQTGDFKMGSLSVSSDPSGVQLFLNGTLQPSRTPCTIENLVPGNYNISLFNPLDSASYTGMATVYAGRTENTNCKLINQFDLHLKTNVQEGTVFLDGKKMGNIYDFRGLQRGPHTIVVKAKDYYPAQENIYINSDRNLDLTLKATPNYFSVLTNLDLYLGSNSFSNIGMTLGQIGKHYGGFVSFSFGMGGYMDGYKVNNCYYVGSDQVIPNGTSSGLKSSMGTFVGGVGVRLNRHLLVLAGLGYGNKFKYEEFKEKFKNDPPTYYLNKNMQNKGLSSTFDVVWYSVDGGFNLSAGVKTVGTAVLYHIGAGFCITITE